MPSLLERLREALEPRYEVEAEVASGGMATVFRARDTSLERVVAVKVLRPDLATATGEARFLREARVLASFSHPNMVSIHDAGEADGLFFYIMDFVEGDTLATRLEQGPLDAYGVLRMGRDLLAALQRIHEAGVVHRDVKPGNVFLVDGRTLLADFGVASVPASGDDVLTREGGGPGTPAYMAPEQIAGRSATPRSDVYATGMLLFEAFTGRRWQALTVPERADWSGVPIAARPVLCRALAVDPDDRWPDAASFGTALRVRGPVLRVPRWAAFLGGAAALVVLAVLAYSLGGSGGANIDPAGYDVAVFPCEAGNVADSSLAFMVGRLVALNLEDVPGISTAPKNEAARRFHGRSGDLTSDDWVGALGARHGLKCDLLRTGDGLDVGWRVLGPAGELVREGMVSARGDSAGLALDAATELTLAVLRVFRVETVTPETAARLSDYPFAAVRALLHGEKALLRGAWPVAELHYRDALSIDSTFTLARWRLAEVHRWLAHDPIDEDLVRIFHMDAASLSPLDSLLLYARVQPPGPAKYAAYEDILSGTTYRRDAYATLLYADELYHRGGLWGVPLDSAIALFDLAVRRDSALVPAVEHLTQAMIRTGDREAAERLLPQLAAIHPSPAESDPYYPAMWSQGVLERFHPEQAKQGREDLLRAMCDTPECRVRLLTLITRWVRYLDLPATQHALGVELAATAEAAGDPSLVAAGSLARGTALVTLGQIGEANVAFDEAAQHRPSVATRLQAAEWRVVPFALGLEGFEAEPARQGALRLEAVFEDERADPALRARAAWALALYAGRRGDNAARDAWSGNLDRLAGYEGAYGRMRRMLAAVRDASGNDYEAALRTTAPDLAYDSAGLADRPFTRSALYLERGAWYREIGMPDSAVASWLWHENTDIEGTIPPYLVQAAEVDGALGVHARLRIIETTPDADFGCPRARDVARLWTEPDRALRAVRDRAVAGLADCPP
jgi:hypothetical protein